MIRRAIFATTTVLAFALVAPANAHSQNIFVLAGLSIPSSDYGDVTGTGWLAAGGVTFPVGTSGLWAGAEGLYGGNGSDFDDGESGNIWSVMGLLGYDIAMEGVLSPYVWGGLGIMGVDLGFTDSGFGWQVGGGVSFDQGASVTPFVEVRYQSASGLQDDFEVEGTASIFGIEGGVSFAL